MTRLTPADGSADELVRPTRVQAITAERMTLSAREVPRVTLFADIDFSASSAFRSSFNAAHGGAQPSRRLSYDAIIIRSAAFALLKHPGANAQWESGLLRRVKEVAVGMAVQTDRGLLVPVVRQPHRLSWSELAEEVRRLVQGAKTGGLTMDDFAGATFTVTNLGGYGVTSFTPLVNPPQAAILGVGEIAPRPTAFNGRLAIRTIGTVALTFDHRVLDGAPASLFLESIRAGLEAPASLS